MTPLQIQQKLIQLLSDLGQANEELTQKEKEYTELKNLHEMEYSKAYLRNKVEMGKATVAEIDHKTFLNTQASKVSANIAEGLYKAKKNELELVKIKIDTLRSLLSYSKIEFERTA